MKKIFKVPTYCPHCTKIAEDQFLIEAEFGFRNMGDGTIRVQSWCKECRSRYSKHAFV